MAKHGYQVKWHQEHGQCYGTGQAPWETKEGLEVAKAYLTTVLETAQAYYQLQLNRLQSGEVRELSYRAIISKEWKKIHQGEEGWDWRLREKISDVKNTVDMIDGDITRIKRRIAAWEPGELTAV